MIPKPMTSFPTFLEKNFLDFLVLWVSKDLGHFLRAFSPVCRSEFLSS